MIIIVVYNTSVFFSLYPLIFQIALFKTSKINTYIYYLLLTFQLQILAISSKVLSECSWCTIFLLDFPQKDMWPFCILRILLHNPRRIDIWFITDNDQIQADKRKIDNLFILLLFTVVVVVFALVLLQVDYLYRFQNYVMSHNLIMITKPILFQLNIISGNKIRYFTIEWNKIWFN